MGFEERRRNNLQKAQKKLKRTELLYGKKEFKVKFDRKSNRKFLKFIKTRPHITVGEKTAPSTHGLVHGAVRFTQEQVIGDVPSITKKINSYKPKTFKGKAFKLAAKSVNFAVHDVGRTAVDVALASEAATLKVGKYGAKKLTGYVNQKFESALDETDTGKVLKATKTLSIAATSGAIKHFKMREKNHLEKAKFKLKKAEYKVTKKDVVNPQLKANSKAKKALKKKYKLKKKNYEKNFKGGKNGTNAGLHKAAQIRRKQRYKTEKKQFKLDKKSLKSQKKFSKKEYKTQKKIAKLSKQTLGGRILKFSGKAMAASAWQKVINADENNDALKALDGVKKAVAAPLVKHALPSREIRLHKKEVKRNKLQQKQAKSGQKLNRQQSKLNKNKKKPQNKKKAKNKRKNLSFKKKLKKIGSLARERLGEILRAAAPYFVKILLSACAFVLIFTFFVSLFGNSAFVLGTYTAQDIDLTEAEEYYTKLAWDMNEEILKLSGDDWKKGLKNLGVNTDDYDDDPTEIVWGQSEQFDYVPNYDYDPWELWSFLCAFYYDYDTESASSSSSGSEEFWVFDSDGEDVLTELFNMEYTFEQYYNNRSYWREKESYDYYGGKFKNSDGGSSWNYWSAEGPTKVSDNSNWTYQFKPTNYPSEIAEFLDSDGYLYLKKVNGEYRIVNPNHKWHNTGYIIQDQRFYCGDSSPAYSFRGIVGYYDNTSDFYIPSDCSADGEEHDRDSRKWGDEEAWFMITPENSKQIFSDVTEDDVWFYNVIKKYYWETDVQLYYNVKQNKTFDECIREKLQSMSHGDERIEYYNYLLGLGDVDDTGDDDPMYGLHQMLKSMTGTSITESTILNGYGYDVQAWNTRHCSIDDIHEGVDIEISSTALYAPFDCEIEYYNEDEKTVVLRRNDVQFWYEVEKGESGITRDIEVIVTNVMLADGLAEDDTLKSGDYFAYFTADNLCSKNFKNLVGKMSIDTYDNDMSRSFIHVMTKIDTDGVGWDYVDPRLLFY